MTGPAWELKGQVAKSVKGAGSESLVCRRKHGNAVGSSGCHYESHLHLRSDVHKSFAASEPFSKSLA